MNEAENDSQIQGTFEAWSRAVRELDGALRKLTPRAAEIGTPPPDDREWRQLLSFKLVPQASQSPLLVVAVVGGTNIGKSLVFNHLAGTEASRSGPLAAGTKHPVCLAPSGFSDEDALRRIFAGFELRPWQSPDDAILESDHNLLFWRTNAAVPSRLLLLDTPDIDSNAEVNWQRADHVRQAADVLIAVLTEQKYNDAAVKVFFRKAFEADKPVIVVFNQCDLEDDAEYWPQWLATFCEHTGGQPLLVYVVPRDRKAAAELQLPFYEVGPDGKQPANRPGNIRNELASLHFSEIKLRTLRGALVRVLDADHGAPAYLTEIRKGSRHFAVAAEALSATRFAQVQWPSLPPRVLVDEIRAWWDARRSPWSRKVHSFYGTLGRGLTMPVAAVWKKVHGPEADPLDLFQEREREAVVAAVGKLIDELERLAEVGNDILRGRLQSLLSGDARRKLLNHVQQSHAKLTPVDDDYREFLRAELDAWGKESPRAIGFLRSLDHVAAVARPAITVSLVVSGWVVAGSLVHDAAVQAAGHTAAQLATEAAITGGITGGGEVAVSAGGEGIRYAAAQLFRRLQVRYAEQRANWLAQWLERELLGDLLADLRRGAELPMSAEFRAVENALGPLTTFAAR